MSIVTLDCASLEDSLDAFRSAWISAAAEDGVRISFASPELLWRVLTAKRWELLKAMTNKGPMSLREAARRVGRDVKPVHGDAHALIDAGILRKLKDGRLEFPFSAVRVEFLLQGEAA